MKSGTDFKELTLIEVSLSENVFAVDKIEQYIVDSKTNENSMVDALINSYSGNQINNYEI